MSQVERTQCLLFVVHGETIQNLRKSKRVSYKSLVEGYALLPLSVRKKYPDVPALFKRNNIKVLTSGSKYRSLLTALKSGKCEIIEILLENDGKLYEIKTTREKILHVTVDKSNKNLVKLLLKKEVKFFTELPRAEKIVVNPVTDPDNVKILKSLFVHGADIDVRCQEARVLIHLAALRNDETLAQLLLQHGADINSSRSNGVTALHVAANQGHVPFIKLLLKRKANVDALTNYDCEFTNATPLHFAVHKKRCEAMKILLDHGADVNLVGFEECTVLEIAVHENSLEMVKLILDYHPDLNSENNKSAFHHSIYVDSEDSTEMVNKMQNYGFTLDLGSKRDHSLLLHGAVCNNNSAMVEKLLKEGLDIGIPYCSRHDNRFTSESTPLHTAAAHGREEMIKLLLRNGARINSSCKVNQTPIFYAAKNGHLNTLKLLIESGGDIHLRDNYKNTPLHFAAGKGSVETVQFLLLNNLDVNAKNDSEETAVFAAVTKGHLNVVEVLLKSGANINLKRQCGASLLHVAVKNLNFLFTFQNCENAERIVEFLLQNGTNSNDVDNAGRTPLFTAVRCNLKIVQLLSNYGANLRLEDNSGKTALHIAAAEKYPSAIVPKIVKFLLKSGVNVNVKSNDGRTPLFGAAKEGNEEIIRILLEFGALVNVTDKNHSFILLESFKNYYSKPFQYLLSYCFSDLEVFSSANIEKLCSSKQQSRGYYSSDESEKILHKYLIKMKVAFPDLWLNFDQNWLSQNLINDAALERELTEEIARMKDDKIGNTDVTFFEVLTKNIKQLACLTKNSSCTSLLFCKSKYPNYGDIIGECYNKGSSRRYLLEHCTKTFRLMFKNCPTLPYDVTEEILDYLSNQDLIILKSIFPTVE